MFKISLTMTVLNGVQLYTYILQIKIQKELEKLTNFRDIKKIERKNSISIRASGYEDKKKYPIFVTTKRCEDKHVDLLLIGAGEK